LGGGLADIKRLPQAALTGNPSFGQTLTCETHGDIRHCWDERGNTVVTEERHGDYIHGHDNRGGAWTTWEHNRCTETWPTR
jgi:hypothetical protein